jgi:hypothetical protein
MKGKRTEVFGKVLPSFFLLSFFFYYFEGEMLYCMQHLIRRKLISDYNMMDRR